MRKHFIPIVLLFLTLLSVCCASADYSFSVPYAEVEVIVQEDGKVSVAYGYVIENLGQDLDFIDIGTPNRDFSLSDVSAAVRDTDIDLRKISFANEKETGLKYGVTLDIREDPIRKGETAVAAVVIENIGSLLYEADVKEKEEEYVGLQFMPNYFNSDCVKGKTDYIFRIIFPEGLAEDDPYYTEPKSWKGEPEPESWFNEDGFIVYEWHYELAEADKKYIFGAQFPADLLTSRDEINIEKPSDSNWDKEAILGCSLCLFPVLGIIILCIVANKKGWFETGSNNAHKYLPPKIDQSGEGIKRGLTAVEAAVLLELDIDRVISMILYGLMKKGVVAMKANGDFIISEKIPEDLHPYELEFIEMLRIDGKKKRQAFTTELLKKLIESTADKMKGFDYKQTKAYYEDICKKAWSQVAAAGTPDLKAELFEKNFGWAMLTDKPEAQITSVFSDDDFYAPSWWWRMDPSNYQVYEGRCQPKPASAKSSHSSSSHKKDDSDSSRTQMPVLPGAMFARSITDRMRTAGKSVTTSITGTTNSIKTSTNPSSSGSSYSSGSGSGGGSSCDSCACACDCDSCACACAGGGR